MRLSWKPERLSSASNSGRVRSRPPRAELVRRIGARVATQLHLPADAPLPADRDLKELGLGSLNAVVLVIGLEEEFGISFSDEVLVMDNFRTVDTIAALVEAS
jgi:acyl carrier protein